NTIIIHPVTSAEYFPLSLHDALPIYFKLWTSYAITPEEASDLQRGSEHVATVGRLKPGASIEQLEAQMTAIIARNAERFVGMDKDRKSTRLNSSHVKNSYAVICLQKT